MIAHERCATLPGLSSAAAVSDAPRLPQPWEGKWNVPIERRKHRSLYVLYLVRPSAGWLAGAARYVRFDGKSEEDD